jgi:chemotaxis protein CheZ
MESSGDSSELEALFDSIADKVWGASLQSPAPARIVAGEPSAFPNDSADPASSDTHTPPLPPEIKDKMRRIAALFDTDEAQVADGSEDGEEEAEDLPENAAALFPGETEEALRRVAELTGQLADRMRDALGAFGPLCDDLEAKGASLAVRWDLLYANKISIEEFKRLASDTCAYLKNVVPQTMAKARESLSQTAPLQESSVSASRLSREVLSHFQEFEARRTANSRKADI